MKKIFNCIGFFGILLLSSGCRRMSTDFNERKASVLETCHTCTFVMSERRYYACDTGKQPNIIYQVYFKNGGWFFKASDIDHLVRIN